MENNTTKGPTKQRDTKRAAVVDWLTLLIGAALVITQVVEYVQGNIVGSKVEVGTFVAGLLLMVKPTLLVDIVNAIAGKFTK